MDGVNKTMKYLTNLIQEYIETAHAGEPVKRRMRNDNAIEA